MTEKSRSLYDGFCADMKAKIDGLNDTEYQKAIKVKELQNLLNSIGYERSGHGDNNKRRPETTITCAICGAPTDGKNNTKKYCDDCKMTKKKAR